jgi:hypothetical protein
VCAAIKPAVFVSAKYSLGNNLGAVLTDTFPAKPPKTIVAHGIFVHLPARSHRIVTVAGFDFVSDTVYELRAAPVDDRVKSVMLGELEITTNRSVCPAATVPSSRLAPPPSYDTVTGLLRVLYTLIEYDSVLSDRTSTPRMLAHADRVSENSAAIANLRFMRASFRTITVHF